MLVQKSYEEVTAPISGEVITEYKSLGTVVSAGTPIIMIGDFSELFCAVTVPDRLAKNLSTDSSATFLFQRQESTGFYDESIQNLGMYINADTFSAAATISEIPRHFQNLRTIVELSGVSIIGRKFWSQ